MSFVQKTKSKAAVASGRTEKSARLRLEKCTRFISRLIMGGVGGGLIVLYNTVNAIEYKSIDDNQNTSSSHSSLSTGPTELDLNSGELLNDPMILNIMLFGEDSRKAGEEHGRSDTMIMLSIDNRHKKLKLTSFMRDTYVTIPGNNSVGEPYGENKLNAAYTLGGRS